ncbi:MAG TPA: hypothetical protein VLG37_04565 [Candidatus Saccharimonadales bacterium]|nr:hypothetical protein [Candidatus Saccharimonadales bacterium]
MISDALALIEFLQKNKAKYDTLSALFNAEGDKIEGSQELELEILQVKGTPEVWFYKVKPLPDYVFMTMPVVSCYTDYGTELGRQNPTSDFFRFVANPLSNFTSKPVGNLKVNFSVIAYKPKQLLDKLE